MSLRHCLLPCVRGLAPGCFALVMASGIVAIDAHQHGLTRVALLLLGFNLVAYAGLLLATLARLALFGAGIARDLRDPTRAAGFLTFSAGSCVLASQCLLLVHWPLLAWALALAALLAWLVLLPRFIVTLVQAARQARLVRAIGGGWLIAVVATQGLAIAAILLATPGSPWREGLAVLALAWFVFGSLLYLPLIGLIVWRLLRRPLRPRDLTPPYWITMGALAISTLAGSLLVQHADAAAVLARWRPLLVVATATAWSVATAWIPLLLALWSWRARALPLRHSREDWTIVFPLGMYTVGSFELARALDLAWLQAVPRVGVWVSLAAWALVASGGARRGWRLLRVAAWRRARSA